MMRPVAFPLPGGPSERSEALLLGHLSPDQRREYRAGGSFTIVKHGVIWRTVATYAAAAVALGVLAIAGRLVPGLSGATVVAGIAFVAAIASFLVWIPPLAIACTTRRVWVVGWGRRPLLRVRGRTIVFCVRVRADVPEPDRLLAFKNAIEGAERYFLRRANALV
jgi:hypothetical protein